MAKPDIPVNLVAKLAMFDAHWTPHTVAAFNDLEIKVAKVQGEFNWHDHPDTDEVFMVIKGSLTIEMEGRDPAVLGAGELFVVPMGVQHRPIAAEECEVVLIEPAGVPNTGDETTAAADVWI